MSDNTRQDRPSQPASAVPSAEAKTLRSPDAELAPASPDGPTSAYYPSWTEGVTLPPSGSKRPSPHKDPAALPGYEILGELGRGGMGVVYKARQVRANRLVALKMILAGGHADADDLARFRTEAQAIARLQHPNIVQIYEVGEHDGRPFFSLELCEGGGLDRRLAGAPLPPDEAARLAEMLARAVHVAHAAGIIHRDLKPANVLLVSGEDDSLPLAKITDFGLAKRLDEASRTTTGAVMGTPSYMAPEQAAGQSDRMGPAADVYSLGAVLYECLTGRPPFRAATSLDTILQVLNEEVVAPRRLNSKVPRDLETICLKCLRKEPSQRYASALDLAEDLRRFRAGEPVRARPVGGAERAWRWCRRKPAVAALAASVLLLLMAVAVVASLGYARTTQALGREAEQRADAERAQKRAEGESAEARRQEQEAERQGAAARAAEAKAVAEAERRRRLLYDANMQMAAQGWESPDVGARAVGALLAETSPAPGEADPREFAWRHQWWLLYRSGVPLATQGVRIKHAAFTPDGVLVTVNANHRLRRWDAAGKATLDVDLTADGKFGALDLAPDGKFVAVVPPRGAVRVYDAATGKRLRTLGANDLWTVDVRFLADGRTLLARDDGGAVRLWDAATGKLRETVAGGDALLATIVPLSPDGRTAAVADKGLRLRDWRTGKELATILKGGNPPALAWAPGGKVLAFGDVQGRVHLRDLATNKPLGGALLAHVRPALRLAFSRDGGVLVTGGGDGQVTAWDVETGELLRRFKAHAAAVSFVCVAQDGKSLASGGADGTARLWRLGDDAAVQRPTEAQVYGLAYSADGRTLAVINGTAVHLWDVSTGKTLQTFPPRGARNRPVLRVALAPDGKTLATDGRAGQTLLWNTATGERRFALAGAPDGEDEAARAVGSLAFSPDGKLLAAGYGHPFAHRPGRFPKVVKVWDAHTGAEVRTLAAHDNTVPGLAFSHDGRLMATAGQDGVAKLWRVGTWAEERRLPGQGVLKSVAFAPDGRTLVTGNTDGVLRVWDVATGERRAEVKGHGSQAMALAFAPDGATLASAGGDRVVRLWDTATWRELRTLRGHEAAVLTVAFAPDGDTLVSGGLDKVVRFWRAVPAREIAPGSGVVAAPPEPDDDP